MTEFVKICPQCQLANPEYENVCSGCGHFIAMEVAVQAPVEPASVENQPQEADVEVDRNAGEQAPVAPTMRYQPEQLSFYLELTASGDIFTIENGTILGQRHASSKANVQIPPDRPGAEFLHRQHCRFSNEKGQWRVQAMDQIPLGQEFTNPTFVNQNRLGAGQWAVLANGDQIRLSGLLFEVKMVGQ